MKTPPRTRTLDHRNRSPIQHQQQNLNQHPNICHLRWLLWAAALALATQLARANLIGPVAPQYHQHNNILHFVVPEGAPTNTYLGNIRSADGQTPSYVLPTPLTPENERLAALSVNLSTGDLITCGQLDREHREQYSFIAIVSSPFAEIRCTVTVKDINDNAPMFLMPANENNFVIEIPEGQRGIRRPLPMAVDLDSFQFGVQEFHFLSGNTPTGTFKIVEHEAPASQVVAPSDDASSSILAPDNPQLQQQLAQQSSVLIPSQPVVAAAAGGLATPLMAAGSPAPQRYLIDLEVNQTLDRENQSSYQLVLEAVDKGQPPLYGRLMVTVNVQDVNDNEPVFTRKLYECQHKEDAPKGTLLVRVQAHDVDLDANGQISYLIKRHSSSSQPSAQQANNSSDTSTNTIVDNLAGVASSNNRQYATTSSNNSKRPVSSAQIPAGQAKNRPQGSNEIYESSEPPSNANQNQQFKKLAATGGHELFEIDPVKGEIYLAQQLDYETDQAHELLIEARDHGKPPRSAYAIVKVLVLDINDDPLPKLDERRSPTQAPLSDPSNRSAGDSEVSRFLQVPLLLSWFSQLNSSLMFVIVLVALFAVAFSVCLVKTKSRQPESDYNDTAGLTLTSNNGQTKISPNHSASNEHHQNGSLESHHRHHEHQRRSINGSFAGHPGLGAGFGLANGKLPSRYHCSNSSNLYHNLHSHQASSHLQPSESLSNHQVATGVKGLGVGGGGSAGNTMTLHNGLGPLGSPGNPHSLEHPFLNQAHHSSSLTYAHHHSRAALLHQAHHHQSSHHLSSMQHGHNKGGTMNSVGTHHSALPSASPLPATPNTTHSSGLPPNLAEGQHVSGGHGALLPLPPAGQQSQLPPTPCNAITSAFPWPQTPGSTMGCFPACAQPMLAGAAALDSTPSSQPQDCWLDPGVPSQLAHDWYSSYEWDYLSDWAPEYHTLMLDIAPADA